MTLTAGSDEAIMYVAKPTAAGTAKRLVLGRCGKRCCAKIATPKAANVSARRRGCANNPVEPAAIQAAARSAIAATRPTRAKPWTGSHLPSAGWTGSNPPTAGSTARIRLGKDPSIRISLSFFGSVAVHVQLKKQPLKKRLIADCRAGIIST